MAQGGAGLVSRVVVVVPTPVHLGAGFALPPSLARSFPPSFPSPSLSPYLSLVPSLT